MTSLFGCICNQPERLAAALAAVRPQLVAPAPVLRWGLAYIQAGEVLLNRTPRQSDVAVDLYGPISAVKSDYVVVHAATADDGLHGTANTQPFRFRHWMFAMDGTGAEIQQVVPQLLEHVPDFLRRNIKGKTSAELVFHLFLSFLHDSGHLDDPNLSTTDSRRALRDALAMVLTLLTKAGAGGASLGNLITSNGRSLLGVRLDAPLHIRRLKVHDAKQKPDTFKGVLVLSATDPGEGFEEVPARSVVAVSRDVRVDIVPLDS